MQASKPNNVIHSTGYYYSLEFVFAGRKYEVSQSNYGDNYSVWDAVDTIRNLQTREKQSKTRREWKDYFNRKQL